MRTIQLINTGRLDDGRLNGFYNVEAEIYCDVDVKNLFLKCSKKISVYQNDKEIELDYVPNYKINDLLKEVLIGINTIEITVTKLSLLKLSNLLYSYFSKFYSNKDTYVILKED